MAKLRRRVTRLEDASNVQCTGPDVIEIVGVDPQTGEEIRDGHYIHVKKGAYDGKHEETHSAY